MTTRRRSFSRSRDDGPCQKDVEDKTSAEVNASKEARRKDAGRRFSLTGMADLAEFANVDQRLSPEKRLQQVGSPPPGDARRAAPRPRVARVL